MKALPLLLTFSFFVGFPLISGTVIAQSALPADTLEPADLGITKHVLGVNCSPGEVAVITVTNNLSDQAPAKWQVVVKEPDGHVQESVLVIDRAFFKPEAEGTYTLRLPGHVFTVNGMKLVDCETKRAGPQWIIHFEKSDAPAPEGETPTVTPAPDKDLRLTVQIEKKTLSQVRAEHPTLPQASQGQIRYVSPALTTP